MIDNKNYVRSQRFVVLWFKLAILTIYVLCHVAGIGESCDCKCLCEPTLKNIGNVWHCSVPVSHCGLVTSHGDINQDQHWLM